HRQPRRRWRLSQKKAYQQYLSSIRLDHKTLEIMKKSFLAILIYCSFLISCSTINKQRSAQKQTNHSESQLTETRQHQLDSQASQWLQSWLQQLQFSTTLIHSDSTISYL